MEDAESDSGVESDSSDDDSVVKTRPTPPIAAKKEHSDSSDSSSDLEEPVEPESSESESEEVSQAAKEKSESQSDTTNTEPPQSPTRERLPHEFRLPKADPHVKPAWMVKLANKKNTPDAVDDEEARLIAMDYCPPLSKDEKLMHRSAQLGDEFELIRHLSRPGWPVPPRRTPLILLGVSIAD